MVDHNLLAGEPVIDRPDAWLLLGKRHHRVQNEVQQCEPWPAAGEQMVHHRCWLGNLSLTDQMLGCFMGKGITLLLRTFQANRLAC